MHFWQAVVYKTDTIIQHKSTKMIRHTCYRHLHRLELLMQTQVKDGNSGN